MALKDMTWDQLVDIAESATRQMRDPDELERLMGLNALKAVTRAFVDLRRAEVDATQYVCAMRGCNHRMWPPAHTVACADANEKRLRGEIRSSN